MEWVRLLDQPLERQGGETGNPAVPLGRRHVVVGHPAPCGQRRLHGGDGGLLGLDPGGKGGGESVGHAPKLPLPSCPSSTTFWPSPWPTYLSGGPPRSAGPA